MDAERERGLWPRGGSRSVPGFGARGSRGSRQLAAREVPYFDCLDAVQIEHALRSGSRRQPTELSRARPQRHHLLPDSATSVQGGTMRLGLTRSWSTRVAGRVARASSASGTAIASEVNNTTRRPREERPHLRSAEARRLSSADLPVRGHSTPEFRPGRGAAPALRGFVKAAPDQRVNGSPMVATRAVRIAGVTIGGGTALIGPRHRERAAALMMAGAAKRSPPPRPILQVVL